MLSENEWPERVKRLPRHGGFPIPYFALVKDGVPDFRVFDPEHYRLAIAKSLCGICGVHLGRKIFFIGGMSVIMSREFKDLPMHIDCAIFSLNICPFLSDEERDFSDRDYPAGYIVQDKYTRVVHPKISLLYMTDGYSIKLTEVDGQVVSVRIVANKPKEIKFYQAGEVITKDSAFSQFKEAGVLSQDELDNHDFVLGLLLRG